MEISIIFAEIGAILFVNNRKKCIDEKKKKKAPVMSGYEPQQVCTRRSEDNLSTDYAIVDLSNIGAGESL